MVIREGRRQRLARFGALCGSCPLRSACTKAHRGRVISIHPHEAALQHAKARQKTRTGARITGPVGPSSNEKSATSPPGPWVGATPAAVAQTDPDRHLDSSQRTQPRPTGPLGLHHGPGDWAIA
nr:transposase [Mycobacterium riyadhense]